MAARRQLQADLETMRQPRIRVSPEQRDGAELRKICRKQADDRQDLAQQEQLLSSQLDGHFHGNWTN